VCLRKELEFCREIFGVFIRKFFGCAEGEEKVRDNIDFGGGKKDIVGFGVETGISGAN
jgi:hypothetical protein